MEHEFQGQDMSLLNEESAIINIQRKLSSSKSNSLRRQGRDMSPSGSEIEYPLKELKPKIGTGSQHPSKKNNSLRMNPVISTQQPPIGQELGHGSDNFESLEPSRYPSDNMTNK